MSHELGKLYDSRLQRSTSEVTTKYKVDFEEYILIYDLIVISRFISNNIYIYVL